MRPHRWQPTRLPHPWDSPGKNTGVGTCYSRPVLFPRLCAPLPGWVATSIQKKKKRNNCVYQSAWDTVRVMSGETCVMCIYVYELCWRIYFWLKAMLKTFESHWSIGQCLVQNNKICTLKKVPDIFQCHRRATAKILLQKNENKESFQLVIFRPSF